MRKAYFLFTIVALLVLAGCVAPTAPAPSGATAPAVEEAAAPAASACEGPLKFWTFEYAPEVVTLIDQYVADWNASHEV